MKKDGPPALSLSERMRQRINDDTQLLSEHRSMIETMLDDERRLLAQSLRSESERVRSVIQNSTAEALSEMKSFSAFLKQEEAKAANLIQARTTAAQDGLRATFSSLNEEASHGITRLLSHARMTAIVSVTILLSAAAILFGMTWWAHTDLTRTQDQLVTSRSALSELQRQTNRIEFWNTQKGKMMLLPKGTEQEFYTCENRLCLKLPEN